MLMLTRRNPNCTRSNHPSLNSIYSSYWIPRNRRAASSTGADAGLASATGSEALSKWSILLHWEQCVFGSRENHRHRIRPLWALGSTDGSLFENANRRMGQRGVLRCKQVCMYPVIIFDWEHDPACVGQRLSSESMARRSQPIQTWITLFVAGVISGSCSKVLDLRSRDFLPHMFSKDAFVHARACMKQTVNRSFLGNFKSVAFTSQLPRHGTNCWSTSYAWQIRKLFHWYGESNMSELFRHRVKLGCRQYAKWAVKWNYPLARPSLEKES